MMGYRIFITGTEIACEAKEVLRDAQCDIANGDPRDTPEIIASKLKAFNPDGMIVRQGKINSNVMDAAQNLKAICKHGVGVDNIDIHHATKLGIPVMITVSANYECVAEHALALIFTCIRRIPAQDKKVRQGIFGKKDYEGQELLNKTLGLIGFGRTGRRLSELVVPLNMKVLVYDPYVSPESLPLNAAHVQELDELLLQSDIISLHCSLTENTRGLINEDAFNKMKPEVFLINTARGPIIKEPDLIKALKNQDIAGAALDTFETEPPEKDNPLFSLDNVIMTNHISGISDSSLRRMGISAAENLLAVLNGNDIDIECVLNAEVLKKD